MSYVKYGVVTKIEILKNREDSKDSKEFLTKLFNLDMYVAHDNVYYIRTELLNEYVSSFRNEFLSFTNGYGDSISDCDAYCLETNIDELFKHKICFEENYEKYYYSGYDFCFDMDCCQYCYKKVSIRFSFIPIFWDINKIVSEDFKYISMIVNNLTRTGMKNPLRNAGWCSIV